MADPAGACSAERRNAPTAPGTVGMTPSMSYMRRSRLNPTTYSRCCQRPRKPLRLNTLVFPLTAPTSGSASGRHELPDGVRLENRVPVD